MKITPMLEQYLRAKSECADALLLFRLGDFYELFFEDAETAAGVLDITLTTRSKKDEIPIPMCGVPHHSAQGYIARLLAAGHKVALCDQVEEASPGKKLVRREVVRVLTPGTVTEEEYLDPKQPNYLLALQHDAGGRIAAVWVDLSTGDLRYVTLADAAAATDLLLRLAPREVIVPSAAEDLRQLLGPLPQVTVSTIEAPCFDVETGERWVQRAGGDAAAFSTGVTQALGGVVWYLEQTHRASLEHLRPPAALDEGAVMVIDEASRRHLELLATTRGERRGSLLSVLDRTMTPMGGRLLREWLVAPLTGIAAIGRRLDAVEAFTVQPARRDDLRRRMAGVGDLERLNARLAARRVNPRDLLGLAAALATVADLRRDFVDADPEALRACRQRLFDLADMRARIERTIDAEAPLKPRPGTLIRPGCDAHVDELRDLAHSGKRYLSEMEARERAATGIPSLKVKYNNVFGYYIEVTKANLRHVPQHYRRKQTTAGAERYVTDELEAYEAKVLGAEEKLAGLEACLFDELVDALAGCHDAIGSTATALAELDVYAGLAHVADQRGYVRPRVHSGRSLRIDDGRHPVVEMMAGRAGFVGNDCVVDPDERQILILTGPNMAGKSTYLRQVALITLMAQMGCFVPAADAEIGIVDRLFTRIGAADNLAGGESTFMVEMKETANIIRQLTGRSLAVLDEIGRGTSTFDGISIAWAVVEHLHDSAQRPLVLFATHYHELTDLGRTRERAHNLSVAVREWKGDVLFLRRVVEGPASQSYGIQVAALAGVPQSIVARARGILANLEKNELTAGGAPALVPESGVANRQMSLFAPVDDSLRRELEAIDATAMTPIEALALLDRLSRRARAGGN